MGCPSSSRLLRATAALLCLVLTAVGPTLSVAQIPWDVPIGALVDSGSSIGANTLCGINLAIRDVNANASILPTTRLLLEVGNAGQDPLQGAAEALAQLQRSVVALVGPTFSTVARFVSNMGAAAQVPVLSFAATDPTLSNKARYPYFVRVTHNDQVEMAALADLVKYFQWQRIIVVYADDDFGRNGVLAFSAALAPEEVTIDAQVAVDLNANLTLVTELLGQLRQHETTVFLAHLQPQLVPLVIEAGKLKRPHKSNRLGMFTPGYVWIASDSTMSILPDLPISVLQLGQGIIGTRSYIPKTELLMRVIENWKMLNSTLYPCAGAHAISAYTLFAYDSVWVVAHALEQFFSKGGSFNFTASTTPLDAQSGGNSQLGDILVNTGGADFLNTIYNTTFEGLTGRIAFDKQGDLPSPTFQIVNLVGNTARVIGYWSSAFTFTTAAPQQVSAMSIANATASNSSTGDHNMIGVVWPGGGILIPRGWLFKGVKPLIIAVPNKQGYKEFVSVGDGTGNDRVQGYCIEVFRAALEQLQYDVPYMFVSFGDGSTTPNYTQMVQAVANKAFDAAVGDITITAGRSLIVDFTQPYESSGLVVVVPQTGKGASPWAFTKPFKHTMWLIILLFLLLHALVMWVLEERVKEKKDKGGLKQQLVTMIWFAFNTLFFNLPTNVTTTLGRLVVTVWLVVVLILISSYTASLTSLLTVQQLSSAVQSVAELILSGEPIAYQAGSFVNGYLRGLGVLQSRLIPEQSYEDYNNVLKSGAVGAIVDESPYMELFLSKFCNYAIVGQEFTKSGWGFVFQQGSLLAADISSAILSMSGTGELQRIHDRWLTPSSQCGQDATQLQSTALGLDTYWPLFAITGSVYVAAVLWHGARIWQAKRGANRVSTGDLPNDGPGEEKGYDLRNAGSFSHHTTSLVPAERFATTPAPSTLLTHPAPEPALLQLRCPCPVAALHKFCLATVLGPAGPRLCNGGLHYTTLRTQGMKGGPRVAAGNSSTSSPTVGPTLSAAAVPLDVPIGALVDFASSIGTDTLCGIKLAVGDVNANNSILPPPGSCWMLAMLVRTPSKGLLKLVMKSAEYASGSLAQLRRSVVALVGPTYSTVARFASNMGAAAQVPVLSFAATDPTLSIKARSPYFVRVTHNDKVEMEALADLVKHYQWQHIIIIYADDDFGRNCVLAFSAALAPQEVTIDAQVAVDLDANLTVVTELLGQLRQHETTVFLAHLQPQLVPLVIDAGKFPRPHHVSAANRLGMLTPGYVWIASDSTMSILGDLPNSVLQLGQGIIGTWSYIPKTEVFRHVTEKWKMLNHTLYPCAGANAINAYTLYAYDTVWVVAHALEKFFNEGGSFHFAASTTPLDAQSGGDTQLGEILVNTGGAKFLSTIYNTSFEGLTGRIAFDKQGDLPSPTFQIVNLVGATARVIGYWSSASTFTTAAPEQASAVSTRNATSSNSSTGDNRLLGVIWPGGGILIPRGWLFKGVKPLIIAVPYKQGYKEFVSVGEGTGNDRFQGYCIEIFRAALEQLDYSVPYMFVSFGDGSTTPNYTQMVEAVANKAFDAAVGDITVTAERSLIVDFTQPYESSGLVVVVPQKGTSASPWAFTKPFAWSLWLFIGGLLVLHAFVVWLLEERAKEKEVKGGLKQQLVTMLWFSFNTLFFNLPTTVMTTPGRLVVIVWLVVVLILTSSYTASLTSLLTVQQLSSSIQSVAELILSGQSIAYQAGSFVPAYLRGLGVLQSRLVPEQTYEDYDKVLKSGAVGAIVDESPYMELFLSKYCNYAIVGQEFTKSGWGFVFQQGSLLATDISSAILSMSGSGELQRIHDRWLAFTYWLWYGTDARAFGLRNAVVTGGEAGLEDGPSLEDSGFDPRGLQMTDLWPDTRPTSDSNSKEDLFS
eukprot:SM000048S16547  [mRNA]  locus=s48:328815:349282:- [translate_table: standard]